MDSSARKVKAERDRRRLPARGPVARWTRRFAGLLGTAALLGVGVASAQMVLPDGGEETVIASTPDPTPTATPKPKAKPAKPKRKPWTKKERAAREAAVEEIRRQGFTTLNQSDYDPRAKLRVLIGRPVGDAAGGNRAFFFSADAFIGNDASGPSSKLRVIKKSKSTVTLSYGIYAQGDTAGAPSGRQRVRFRLQDGVLTPLDTVPLDSARFLRRQQ